MYLKGIKIKNDNEAGLLYAYDSEGVSQSLCKPSY